MRYRPQNILDWRPFSHEWDALAFAFANVAIERGPLPLGSKIRVAVEAGIPEEEIREVFGLPARGDA